ncbi:MAG: hypothetical protein AB8I08_36290 [Sandaracinaceae bacterium]
MRRVSVCLLALSLTFAVGCDDDSDPLRPDSGRVDAGGDDGETTYYEDVRPILVENCVMCHDEGGIAPFRLETYAQVTEVAERVREATALRIMPPFLADNSGDCQTYENHRGLTQEEIDTIGAWVDQGTLEGDATTPMPEAAVLPTLSSVDLTIEMEMDYSVLEETDDDYRCFVVDPGLTENAYVTGYDVHPGNAQRVHHVIVYNPVDEAAEQRALELDMEDGTMGDGYPCYGGAIVDAPPLVLWAPGTGATRFPRGTGIELEAGRQQIIQVHYNNLVDEGVATTDRTTIDLQTSDTALQAYLLPVLNTGLSLPPRMESVSSSRTLDLSFLPANVRIFGVMPHMHTLGRTLSVEIQRPTETECAVDVPRWDFNWQLAYWYDDPIRISPEDSATITCTYNTMSRDETTTWGDGTQDEMCIAFVYVSL